MTRKRAAAGPSATSTVEDAPTVAEVVKPIEPVSRSAEEMYSEPGRNDRVSNISRGLALAEDWPGRNAQVSNKFVIKVWTPR